MDHTSVGLYHQATGLLVIAQMDSFSAAARWTRRSSQRVPLDVGDVVVQVVHYQAASSVGQVTLGHIFPSKTITGFCLIWICHFFSGYQVPPSQ